MPDKGHPWALIHNGSPPQEGVVALVIVPFAFPMSSNMLSIGGESTIHLVELLMLRASEPSHRALVGTKKVAPLPYAQGISIDRESRSAVGWGSDVPDQGREIGPTKSSCLG